MLLIKIYKSDLCCERQDEKWRITNTCVLQQLQAVCCIESPMQYSLTSFGDKETRKAAEVHKYQGYVHEGCKQINLLCNVLVHHILEPARDEAGTCTSEQVNVLQELRILSIASRLSSNSYAMSGLLMVVLLFLYLCLSKDCSYSAPLLGC